MALKRFKKRMAMDTEDRLSDMPESLQLDILSRLDARQAVQTLVLSKSWVSTWTHIPVLSFTSCGFDYFVLNALSRRQSVKLDKLTFNHVGERGDDISQVVFDYAFSHGVEELEANIQEIKSWPTGSSDSLTSLKFTSGGCTFMEPRSFKNLTNLYLKGVSIGDLDPFSGFPALEKLTLRFCPLTTTEGNVLNIHAPQLSEFTILFYTQQSAHHCKFTTPKLRYFEWRGSNFPQLTTGNLPILETVVIQSLTLFAAAVRLLTLFPLLTGSKQPPFPKLKLLKLDLGFAQNRTLRKDQFMVLKLVELIPDLKAYLLPKSHHAECLLVVPDEFRAASRKVMSIAVPLRKAIRAHSTYQ